MRGVIAVALALVFLYLVRLAPLPFLIAAATALGGARKTLDPAARLRSYARQMSAAECGEGDQR